MAEYINREAAITALLNDAPEQVKYSREDAADCIRYMDAADVAPVRHGRWEFLGPNRLIGDCMCGTCSVCKVRCKYIVNKNICPNCGATMKLED